jgi:hypothetical protein
MIPMSSHIFFLGYKSSFLTINFRIFGRLKYFSLATKMCQVFINISLFVRHLTGPVTCHSLRITFQYLSVVEVM